MIDEKALEAARQAWTANSGVGKDMLRSAVVAYEQARRDSLPKEREERAARAINLAMLPTDGSHPGDLASAALLAADDAEALIEKLCAWLRDFNSQNEDDAGFSFLDAQEKAEHLQAILDTSIVSERFEIASVRDNEMLGHGSKAAGESSAAPARSLCIRCEQEVMEGAGSLPTPAPKEGL